MHERHAWWYEEDAKHVVERLHSNASRGLEEKEAKRRVKEYGENVLVAKRKQTMLERTFEQLRNPLGVILLIAGIVTLLLHSYVDASIIFVALLVNVLVGLYQEGRADRAFDKLKSSQDSNAIVIRDGVKRLVKSAEIVPGDLLAIEAGAKIAADARVMRAGELTANESILTGEWMEVRKTSERCVGPFIPSEIRNMVFAGSLATAGNGLALVVATGNRTELGRIASSIEGKEEGATPLQQEIARVAQLLSILIIVSLALIFILGLFRHEALSELFLISVAIAVSAIPEGLPAAVTVGLAVGMEALLLRGGLVRNLLAAETLGSTTVILTDKTGTLTRAEMEVSRIITWQSLEAGENVTSIDRDAVHKAHGDERDVLEFAVLASDAFIDPADGVIHGRPVERAVVTAALASGLNQTILLQNYPRLDFLAFSSASRFAASLNDIRGITPNRYHISGAPEYLLEHATHIYVEGMPHPKTSRMTERFLEAFRARTAAGERMIGIAMKDTERSSFSREETKDTVSILPGCSFAGFISFTDPLRPDVKEAVRMAERSGARVIMATGDNTHTAVSIARECGIYKDDDTTLTGDEIAKLTEDELAKALKHATVLSRMLPESKLRVARLLRERGEIVAMTGDGVNDAPALKAANIGVSLGSGTEVAKESSDLVLLNNSFSVIVSAIEEGRRVRDNLKKIIAYLLSTSFGEIIVVGGAMLASAPIPVLPAQILWINLLTEGMLNFAYAFEPKEPDVMWRHPRRHGAQGIVSLGMVKYIVLCSLSTGLILYLLFFTAYLHLGYSIEETRALIFVTLFISAVAGAISIKDLHIPIWKMQPFSNRYLLVALGVAFFGLFVALSVGPITRILSLDSLHPLSGFAVGVIVFLIVLFVHEVGKALWFERRKDA